jgi:hypothetical protein
MLRLRATIAFGGYGKKKRPGFEKQTGRRAFCLSTLDQKPAVSTEGNKPLSLT